MNKLHLIIAVVTSLGLTALLYWLTLEEPKDPCAGTGDLSAAAIADEGLDQDNLVDRAMIERRDCKPVEPNE